MIKEVCHNVLLILLLVVSCGLKSLDKPQGDLHGTIHGNGFGIKPRHSLDELLNPSGILSKEQAAVRTIRSIVTNPNIGSGKNYRTYTDSEFSSLLNNLGIAKVEEMITVYLEIQKKQEEAVVSVKDIHVDPFSGNLLVRLDNYKKDYQVHLKGLFNELIHNDVYVNVIGDDYVTKFIEVIDDAKSLKEIAKFLADKEGVPMDESSVMRYISAAVTNPVIGKREGYKTYESPEEIFLLLGKLGFDKLKQIAGVHLNSVKAQSEALDAIDAIDVIRYKHLKQQVQKKFDTFNAAYSLHIKEAFSKSSLDNIYRAAIVNVNYDAEFNLIKNEATVPANP
ncbi:BTA121 domain-containing protein surface lipoprotein [Borrelia puertoricensis]|uniref:BTA121 domain-containing protein surface lipoprotein n=1 Tax=Borrelia puertoricensis TaxID=2756107 RepID=UPI001FF3775C|nr:hypothetical protein [Borrelia puertoricensis]UPA19021.1 hypothetical protein bpuSUM_001564 [Borrelia puertoricensis]